MSLIRLLPLIASAETLDEEDIDRRLFVRRLFAMGAGIAVGGELVRLFDAAGAGAINRPLMRTEDILKRAYSKIHAELRGSLFPTITPLLVQVHKGGPRNMRWGGDGVYSDLVLDLKAAPRAFHVKRA